jgi:acetyl esterase/lipase
LFTRFFIWHLTIALTEFSHWLALVPLVMIALLVCKNKWKRAEKLTLLFSGCALVVLLYPVASALQNEAHWQNELLRTFGPVKTLNRNILSLTRLWSLSASPRGSAPQTLAYAEIGDEKLTLDFYHANRASAAPLVLVVHGGGWDGGSSRQFAELNRELASLGYAVASVNYRLAPKWQWPAQREDVLAAVTYLKNHSVELGLDPRQWVILGRSAGGQIAGQVAYSLHDPSLRGLVAFYAPTDLSAGYYWGEENDLLNLRGLLRNYLGGTPDNASVAYRAASPLSHITANSPPTLILHGAGDFMLSRRHALSLEASLKASGVRNLLIEPRLAPHDFDFTLKGPDGQLSTYAIEYFLSSLFR